MGRQVRKQNPWQGLVFSHLGHNYYVSRQYRWQSYHSHGKMCTGRPFKTKQFNINANSLLTPDVLKFHVPILHAFTPINPRYAVDKKTGAFPSEPRRLREDLVSASSYKFTEQCQKQIINLNKCIKNIGSQGCTYYQSYLTRHCQK